MAFSPQTGEIILRAAQGLTQTIQLQQQLMQRQEQFEKEFQLRLDNAQAEKKRAETQAKRLEEQLKIQQGQLQLGQQREARLQTESRVRTARELFELQKLRRELRRGGGLEKDLAFIQQANMNRGTTDVFQGQFSVKGAEWGFGDQQIVPQAGEPFSTNVTEVFDDLGGVSLLDRDLLHRRIDTTQAQLADFLEKNSVFIGQTEPGSNALTARAKSTQQGIQAFESQLAAYRAGLRAVGDILFEFSPRQLRDLGGGGDPTVRLLNDLAERRDRIADEYMQTVGLSSGSRLALDEIMNGLQEEGRREENVGLLRSHIRNRLGETREKAVNSAGYPNLVRYIQAFFPSDEEANEVIANVLAGLP